MSTIPDLDPETNTLIHPTPRTVFRQTVAAVAARAKEKLPLAVNGRVEKAVKLVLQADVVCNRDGTWTVGSTSDPMKTYTLAGHACDCQDFAYGQAPEGWCAHRIAAGIHKRVQEVLAQAPPVETPAAAPVPGIDPRSVITVNGRPFVRFEGLLALAHERGLIELSTTVVSVMADFAVCQCVARFQDGRIFTDIGDASPSNVKKHLAPHFMRMAATRASARALRRALNIDAVAVEELGDDA